MMLKKNSKKSASPDSKMTLSGHRYIARGQEQRNPGTGIGSAKSFDDVTFRMTSTQRSSNELTKNIPDAEVFVDPGFGEDV